jgi:hypothetical protein
MLVDYSAATIQDYMRKSIASMPQASECLSVRVMYILARTRALRWRIEKERPDFRPGIKHCTTLAGNWLV